MVARSHQSCIARRTSDDELVTWSICPNGNGVCWGHYFPSTPDREIKEVYDTFMDKVEME